MKLERMHLKNFRCFEELSIDFDPQLTVIVAENGAGKTAILDAIAIGFGRYLTKLPGVSGVNFKDTDIRLINGERRASHMMFGWKAAKPDGTPLLWSGGRAVTIPMTAFKKYISEELIEFFERKSKDINDFALGIVQADAEQRPYFLPVIAYYGTNRAIRAEVQRRRGFKKKFSQFDALIGALEPDSHFRAAFEWFNAMEDVERREITARKDFEYKHPILQLVRSAIVRVLPPGFSNPRTETAPLRFVIDRLMSDGSTHTLRISQLSDGYRVILGLTMDFARRLAQANSAWLPRGDPITSPLNLPAIALIDEVDLHLHPSWQQHVLTDLMRAFPGTQFIVTTHSPLVLSTVKRDNIRVIELTERGYQVRVPDFSPLAHESGDALSKIMGTHRQPPLPILDQIRHFEQLVRAGKEESKPAQRLRSELDEAGYQIHESDLVTWRFLASRKTRVGG